MNLSNPSQLPTTKYRLKKGHHLVWSSVQFLLKNMPSSYFLAQQPPQGSNWQIPLSRFLAQCSILNFPPNVPPSCFSILPGFWFWPRNTPPSCYRRYARPYFRRSDGNAFFQCFFFKSASKLGRLNTYSMYPAIDVWQLRRLGRHKPFQDRQVQDHQYICHFFFKLI